MYKFSKGVLRSLRRVALAATTSGVIAAAGAAQASAPAAINKYTGEIIPNGSVLLVWTGDGCALPVPIGTCSPDSAQDFLAVVDVEPNSTRYGDVIWTAELPRVTLSNILPGGIIANSDAHNDPHHMLSYTSYISGGGDGLQKGRKYTFGGGVISKNVFRYDITSVRNIQKADLVVCGTQPKRSSLTDDFIVMPAPGGDHKIIYTYMGSYGYGAMGTVTEIDPGRNAPTLAGICTPSIPAVAPLLETVGLLGCVGGTTPEDSAEPGHKGITEYPGCVSANQPRNPTNYTSYPDQRESRKRNQGVFFLGNSDAGHESQPHGMGLTYDGKYLATSDYAVPASIGAAAINGALSVFCAKNQTVNVGPLGICGSTYGASVRVWETSGVYNLGKTRDSLKEANVYGNNSYIRSVSAVPDGPRHEEVLFHEENEGLMAFGLAHQSHHCVGQKGWENLGDPSYDAAVTKAGVSANDASKISSSDCKPGDADYVPHDGAFTASMCGGVLYYSPDITIRGDQPNAYGGNGPYWRPVYDVGPCSGVSYFTLSDDDRFLIQPVSGIQSPPSIDPSGSAVFDRDYPRQHSRRVLTVDVRPLLAKGKADTAETRIACDFPPPDATRPANTSLGTSATRSNRFAGASGKFNVLKHNNEADDCPRIRGAIGQFETGPHGKGLPTTVSSNTDQVGTGYLRLVSVLDNVLNPGTLLNNITDAAGNVLDGSAIRSLLELNVDGLGLLDGLDVAGIILNGQQTGGEPSGDGGTPGSGNLNSLQNLYTHGGPHFTLYDRLGHQRTPNGEGGYLDLRPKVVNGLGLPRDQVEGQPEASGSARFAFIQYFVELQHVPGPGTGSDGDRTICLGKFDRKTGATVLDTSFTDELLGTPCLDFDSKARDGWTWPGARGAKGGAKPHAAAFERDGAALFGPGYYPAKPIDADGTQ